MKAAELRHKTDEELTRELVDLHREAFNLRMQKATGQMPRPSQFSSVRKAIARVKTIQNERRAGRSS